MMGTLKLSKKLPEWRKHFKPGEKVDPAKVDKLMVQTYPHLFGNRKDPVPLKIGIHRELLDDPRLPVTGRQCRQFLYRWTKQPAYQRNVAAGKERFGI